MDWSAIIVAAIGGLFSAVAACVAIIPQIKKNKIKTEDIKDAINNSEIILSVKAGLVSEMRKSLENQYWDYSNRGFNLTPTEIEAWNEDMKTFSSLGGTGLNELNSSLQYSLMERERAKTDHRVRKL